MLLNILVMSILLGLSSFGCGMLPLSFMFSRGHLERLSYLGTGLLLGAALGVIIPEGIETIAEANPSGLPTSHVALSLLAGFTFMLVVEQLISPHSHSHDHGLPLQTVNNQSSASVVEFNAELGDLEREQGTGRSGYTSLSPGSPSVPEGDRPRAFAMTLGLIIHALADGLALGVSSITPTNSSESSSNLSLIVFLALIIHKAPTALALTTSLLATSLPRADCKKHLAFFSVSTPLGAIASYLLFTFFGSGDGGWTGVALLLSGGTFLYVATVLQPVAHSGESGVSRPTVRVLFISIGMFIPFILGTLLGHGH